MKVLNLKSLVILFSSLALLVSCGTDDNSTDGVTSFVGNYVITKATLTSDLVLTTNEIGEITVPSGNDITTSIQTALLSAIECTPEKSLIELRDDHTMFMNCEGTARELNAGTWEELSATALKLNMNSSAIPTSASGFVLTVNNVTLANNLLRGETNVPLPQDMLSAMVTQMSGGMATLDTVNTPVVVPVNFAIELTKK